MVATSEDVARRAGVSRATVSQILNGRAAKFAEETRARVLQAAADLAYQPSVAGRALARGSSDFVIGVIPHTTFGSNLQDIFEGLTEELASHGLTLVLRLATGSAEQFDRMITGMMPAAVFSLTAFDDAQRALLEKRGIAAIDRGTTSESDANVMIGELQARYLVKHGHTRLAFAHLHDARQDPFGHSRALGVQAVCREAGLPDPVAVQLAIDPDEAAAALDALRPPGIAIACYNDEVAAALLSAATGQGWRIPQDVALMGMDGAPVSRITQPPLTTVAYSAQAAVQSAIHSILTKLGRGHDLAEPSEPALRIIEGSTVRPPDPVSPS